MTSTGDNTAANKIYQDTDQPEEIDQLEDEVETLRVQEAEADAITAQAAAVAEQFRAERVAREQRLAAALEDQAAHRRRRQFRLIVGGGIAVAWILRRIRDHIVFTAAAATIAAGTTDALVTGDMLDAPGRPYYSAPALHHARPPASIPPPRSSRSTPPTVKPTARPSVSLPPTAAAASPTPAPTSPDTIQPTPTSTPTVVIPDPTATITTTVAPAVTPSAAAGHRRRCAAHVKLLDVKIGPLCRKDGHS